MSRGLGDVYKRQSRNSPVRSAKERKSEEMIHVHAEVVKNIKCAVEEMHSSISYERELG